jgi:hypothetical protein
MFSPIYKLIRTEKAHTTLKSLIGKGAGCYADDYVEKFTLLDVDTSSFDILEDALQNVIDALVYIFRSAIKQRITPQGFAAMRQNTQIDVTLIKALMTQYDAFLQDNQINIQDTSTPVLKNDSILSRLTGLDWKLAVGIASDECTDLACGKVTLSLQLDDHQRYTVELTLEEFQDFRSHFSEMASLINTLQ